MPKKLDYKDVIKELRLVNGKSQHDVAEFLGTTQQVYSRYERGLNEIPVHHIVELCKYYNVSADVILGIKPM